MKTLPKMTKLYIVKIYGTWNSDVILSNGYVVPVTSYERLQRGTSTIIEKLAICSTACLG